MTKQDSVEGRQRETNPDKPGSLLPFVALCLPSIGFCFVMVSRFVSLCLPPTGFCFVTISGYVSLCLPSTGSCFIVISRFVSLCLRSTGSCFAMISRFVPLCLPSIGSCFCHDTAKQDPIERRQRETNPAITTKQDPVEGRQRETNPEIMTKQDPVEGRQRETNLEIMRNQDPIEGRQRETKEDKSGNHVVTKSVSLQKLRTPSAEAVWGKNIYIFYFPKQWLYTEGVLTVGVKAGFDQGTLSGQECRFEILCWFRLRRLAQSRRPDIRNFEGVVLPGVRVRFLT